MARYRLDACGTAVGMSLNSISLPLLCAPVRSSVECKICLWVVQKKVRVVQMWGWVVPVRFWVVQIWLWVEQIWVDVPFHILVLLIFSKLYTFELYTFVVVPIRIWVAMDCVCVVQELSCTTRGWFVQICFQLCRSYFQLYKSVSELFQSGLSCTNPSLSCTNPFKFAQICFSLIQIWRRVEHIWFSFSNV